MNYLSYFIIVMSLIIFGIITFVFFLKNNSEKKYKILVLLIVLILVVFEVFILNKLYYENTDFYKAIEYAIENCGENLEDYNIEIIIDEEKMSIEYNCKCRNGKFISITSMFEKYLETSIDLQKYNYLFRFKNHASRYIEVVNINAQNEVHNEFDIIRVSGYYDFILYEKLIYDPCINLIKEMDIIEEKYDYKHLETIINIFPNLQKIYIGTKDNERYLNTVNIIKNIKPECEVINLY